MTLQKSETVDHPRKREKKTQNTDSHNTIKLELPTQLERTMTNHIKIRAQNKIPKKSEENQSMNKEVWSNRVQYTVCSHLHLLQHLWLIYNKCIRITSYTLSKGPGLEVIKLEYKLRLK